MLYPSIVSESMPVNTGHGVVAAPCLSDLYERHNTAQCLRIITADGHEFEVPRSSTLSAGKSRILAKTLKIGDEISVPLKSLYRPTRKLDISAKAAELLGWLTKEGEPLSLSQSVRFASNIESDLQRVEDLTLHLFPKLSVKRYNNGTSQYLTITGRGNNGVRFLLENWCHNSDNGTLPVALLHCAETCSGFLRGYLSKHAWMSFDGANIRCGLSRTRSRLYCRLQQHVLRHAGINSFIATESRSGVTKHRALFNGFYNYSKLIEHASTLNGLKPPVLKSGEPTFEWHDPRIAGDSIWSLVKIRKIDTIGSLKTYRVKSDVKLSNHAADGNKSN